MARFFYRLDAQPARARTAPTRSDCWRGSRPSSAGGFPQAIGHGWSVWFKGGWRPSGGEENSGAVTHQAALLVHRRGERVALAVLTDEAPWGGGGFEAIEGVTGACSHPRRLTGAAGPLPSRLRAPANRDSGGLPRPRACFSGS